MDEMDTDLKVDKERMENILPTGLEETKTIDLLENKALYLDGLVRITGNKTPEISARLTIMEMKGLVKNLREGKYKKCN